MELLLTVVVFSLAGGAVVGAVDLTTYDNEGCQGVGTVFADIPNKQCTTLSNNPSSLVFSGGRKCGVSSYSDNACQDDFVQGKNSNCLTPGYVIGSAQYVECSIFDGNGRRLLSAGEPAPDSKAPCVHPRMVGVVYTEALSNGTWILKSARAADLARELAAVPKADKANWFAARGGYFQSPVDTM